MNDATNEINDDSNIGSSLFENNEQRISFLSILDMLWGTMMDYPNHEFSNIPSGMLLN